jgi:hypothetical protein
MKLEFCIQLFENYSHIKFHENLFSRSRIVPCRQTDRHDEANSRFSQIYEGACKRGLSYLYSCEVTCTWVQNRSTTSIRNDPLQCNVLLSWECYIVGSFVGFEAFRVCVFRTYINLLYFSRSIQKFPTYTLSLIPILICTDCLFLTTLFIKAHVCVQDCVYWPFKDEA